jgi:hypothetical protein
MKMPIGTEFEVLLNGDKFGCVAKILESSVQSKKQLVWDNRANSSIVVTDSIADAVFKKIQQPVSFMEVVNSNKKCRVEHTFIDNYSMCDNSLIRSMYKKEYVGLGIVLEGLSKFYNSICLKEIIKNGKWYIEESEAECNE